MRRYSSFNVVSDVEYDGTYCTMTSPSWIVRKSTSKNSPTKDKEMEKNTEKSKGKMKEIIQENGNDKLQTYYYRYLSVSIRLWCQMFHLEL